MQLKISIKIMSHQRLMDLRVTASSSYVSSFLLDLVSARASLTFMLAVLNPTPVSKCVIRIIYSGPTTSLMPLGICDLTICIVSQFQGWFEQLKGGEHTLRFSLLLRTFLITALSIDVPLLRKFFWNTLPCGLGLISRELYPLEQVRITDRGELSLWSDTRSALVNGRGLQSQGLYSTSCLEVKGPGCWQKCCRVDPTAVEEARLWDLEVCLLKVCLWQLLMSCLRRSTSSCRVGRHILLADLERTAHIIIIACLTQQTNPSTSIDSYFLVS